MKDDGKPTAFAPPWPADKLRLSYPRTVVTFRAYFADAVLLKALYDQKPGGISLALAELIAEHCETVRTEMRQTQMGRRQLSLLGQLE